MTSNHSTGELEREIHSGIDSEIERPKSSQYITPTCVLLNYYNGDISTVVDEHFSRALSQPSSFTLDKCNNGDRKPGKSKYLFILLTYFHFKFPFKTHVTDNSYSNYYQCRSENRVSRSILLCLVIFILDFPEKKPMSLSVLVEI
jgi:hypothetical protein